MSKDCRLYEAHAECQRAGCECPCHVYIDSMQIKLEGQWYHVPSEDQFASLCAAHPSADKRIVRMTGLVWDDVIEDGSLRVLADPGQVRDG